MIDRRPRAKLFIPGIIFSLVGLRFWLDDTPAASRADVSSGVLGFSASFEGGECTFKGEHGTRRTDRPGTTAPAGNLGDFTPAFKCIRLRAVCRVAGDGLWCAC